MALDYYDYAKLLSHNAVYNFAVGGRGIGKTYGAKRKGIRDALKDPISGDQFIYLRRYKKELQISRDTFFADIQHEFPEWDFKTTGHFAQAAHVDTRDDSKRVWHTIGYFIALSVAQSYKSVAFPRVKTIIYDEFIIEKGAIYYLPDEAKVFNNFFSTVDRYKDKTKVYFLANSVAITNPYFLEFKIDPDKINKHGFVKLFDGFIVAHFIDSEQFAKGVLKTRFGKFIDGTEYADYAVSNQFFDNNKSLIGSKTEKASYICTLETSTGTSSIWYDIHDAMYYAQQKRPKGEERIITLVPERMSEEKTLMTFSDKLISRFRSAYRHDKMRFDHPTTRNAFMETFKR